MPFADPLKAYWLIFFGWLKLHGVMLIFVSVASIVVSILFCTLVIAYLPSDYFSPNRRLRRIRQPVLRISLKCFKKSIRGGPYYCRDYSATLTGTRCFDDADRNYHQRYSRKAEVGTSDYTFAGRLSHCKRHSFSF